MQTKNIFRFTTLFLLTVVLISIIRAQTIDNYAVIVKVKAPSVAAPAIIKEGFIKAIPTYQAIDGLLFKAFSITKISENNYFGGIYLWQNKEKAEKWFSPQWTQQVKSRYGVEPSVELLAIIKDSLFFPKDFDFKNEKTVSIFVKGLTEKDLKQFTKKNLGLLRSYFVKTESGYGAIMLFVNEQTADVFAKKAKITDYQLFQTPVLLNNVK